MGLLLAILATLLVLFMVAAMALAEWADKDPGELWSLLWKRRATAGLVPQTVAPVPVEKSVRQVRAKATVSRAKLRGSQAPGKNHAARKPAAAKRKTR
ncbi:MAG: hypothetical protein HGA76_04560 [Candidatus Firestonebacteria bacterium]|nr:hypothetical protein [Candidatus Firestonebacteria bacterium]